MNSFMPAKVKPVVAFSVFESLDIRLGTIAAVTSVPDSRKLPELTVDFGDHSRHNLAGMQQERQARGELVGCQTLFVINLEPKSMAGRFQKECSWTSGTPMGSSRRSLYLNARCQMALVPVDS
jgi:tRNA-binding protein